VQFAQIMRDQLSGSGIPPSTYVDSGGLNPRADIAELHLAQSHQSQELGNMKNPSDSARMKTLGRP
jgi:N-acetylmuramoyl-L-alanine amidase